MQKYKLKLKQFYETVNSNFTSKLIVHGNKISTIENKMNTVKLFTDFLLKELIDVRKINRVNCEEIIYAYLNRFDRCTTKNKVISILTSYFQSLYVMEIINYDLCLQRQKCNNPLPKALTVEQIMNTLSRLRKQRKSWIDFRNYALCHLLYASGCRLNEALGIDLGDINFEDRIIFLRQTKYDKERIVPVSPSAMYHLVEYLEECPCTPKRSCMFFTQNGAKLKRDTASSTIKRYSGISAHVFRHSYATHMYENGADLFTIKELMGHSCISTTEVYLKVLPKDLVDTVQRLNLPGFV